MLIIKVYGTYYEQERLAWIGFVDRLHFDFKEANFGLLVRKTKSEPGWSGMYVPVIAE